MYLLIDNYDSFVYNLRAYFQELGKTIQVVRIDKISLADIESICPEGIILSPGPKRPWDASLCLEVVQKFQGQIPILGVCLGHQILGFCSGATVEKGRQPMHGKITKIINNGQGLFQGLPKTFKVTRYHSLVVKKETIPPDYSVDSVAEDGAVMGIAHKVRPLYGVQFHPEAVCTEYGHQLLNNFCKIAERYREERKDG